MAWFAVAKDVFALDDFARCWVREQVFYEVMAPPAEAPKQSCYARPDAALPDFLRAAEQPMM